MNNSVVTCLDDGLVITTKRHGLLLEQSFHRLNLYANQARFIFTRYDRIMRYRDDARSNICVNWSLTLPFFVSQQLTDRCKYKVLNLYKENPIGLKIPVPSSMIKISLADVPEFLDLCSNYV